MTPILVTPPAKLPVSLAEVREQLRIDHVEDDATLAGLIEAATDLVEVHLNQALITRTYKAYLDQWPEVQYVRRVWSNYPWPIVRDSLELPRAPLQSVTSIKTYDDSDTPTTFSAASYYVDTSSVVGRIALRTGAAWPQPTRTANGIEITWTAGYGDNPGDIPPRYRLAIIVTVGWLSEQRGDEGSPKVLPTSAEALLGDRIVAI